MLLIVTTELRIDRKIIWIFFHVGGMLYLCISNQRKKAYEPWHEISNNMICATSKASDQPAHTRSQIRAFASRLNIQGVLSY